MTFSVLRLPSRVTDCVLNVVKLSQVVQHVPKFALPEEKSLYFHSDFGLCGLVAFK